jgi:hypothetical protein
MSGRSKFALGMAILLALGLVVFGILAARGPASSVAASVQGPSLVSMDESAQAMQKAGAAMQAHGQTMLDQGKRTGDSELITYGEQWLSDGQALVQGGNWMAENPTAPGSLQTSPADLQAQGNWNELNQRAQAMLHDPTNASSVDIEALLADGLEMKSEGQNMADHGNVMTKEVSMMVDQHKLGGQAATDLRSAAQTMQDVGSRLANNGQQMIDYADRLRRSLGLQ